MGANDGIKRDMTVLNGDGLVGRVTTVGPNTATVLLANDPDFTVGTRMERPTNWLRPGQGDRPLRVELLNGKAKVRRATGWSPSAPRPTNRSSPASRSVSSPASTPPAAT